MQDQDSKSSDAIVSKDPTFLAAFSATLIKGRYLHLDCFEEEVEHVRACISTRLGGESVAPYDSFNLALHVGDNSHQVLKNRELMTKDLELKRICFMEQTHSADVLEINESNWLSEVYHCDALVTKMPLVGLAVMTADCLPVLMCDLEHKVIAAVHCGWRGLAKGIVKNAIEKMEALGASRDNINCCFGPAIGPASFEVGKEVYEAFISKNVVYESAFRAKDDSNDDWDNMKLMCNIYALCKIDLLLANCHGRVFMAGQYDTMRDYQLFYSYRHQKETGRIASVISIMG